MYEFQHVSKNLQVSVNIHMLWHVPGDSVSVHI